MSHATIRSAINKGGVLFMSYSTFAGLHVNDMKVLEQERQGGKKAKDADLILVSAKGEKKVGLTLADEVDSIAFMPATITGGATRTLVETSFFEALSKPSGIENALLKGDVFSRLNIETLKKSRRPDFEYHESGGRSGGGLTHSEIHGEVSKSQGTG
jgi:hypothetical protein